jgi:curved DNA-binding protein CbpA
MKTVEIFYLIGIKNLDELRQNYYKLAKIHHPDTGGDNETMKQINLEFEFLSSKILDSEIYNNFQEAWKSSQWRTNENFSDIISKIIHLNNISIEIIGSWIWATGLTYSYKDILKESGFKFSHKKTGWYWHEGQYRKMSKKSFTLDEIRELFGAEKILKKETFSIY